MEPSFGCILVGLLHYLNVEVILMPFFIRLSQFNFILFSAIFFFLGFDRPFARSGHMVQNHTCLDARCTVRLSKQSNSYQSTLTCLCFGEILCHVAGSSKGPIIILFTPLNEFRSVFPWYFPSNCYSYIRDFTHSFSRPAEVRTTSTILSFMKLWYHFVPKKPTESVFVLA